MTELLTAGNPLAIPGARIHMAHSDDGRRWRVSVAPPEVTSSSEPPHAVFVLDPSTRFLHTASAAHSLMLAGGTKFPPLTIVGVGPDTDDQAELLGLRSYYMLPTAIRRSTRPDLAQLDDGRGSESIGGGADDFADFLARLMPEIDARYGTNPTDHALAGHSFGGLFATHVLLHRTDLFQRYLLSSPSLWWDDRWMLRQERLAVGRTDLAASVFVSVGEREEGDLALQWPNPTLAGSQQVTNAIALRDQLAARGYPSLRLTSWVVPGESHTTVPFAAFARGLLELFALR